VRSRCAKRSWAFLDIRVHHAITSQLFKRVHEKFEQSMKNRMLRGIGCIGLKNRQKNVKLKG